MRQEVARVAAELLYTGTAKEYKQAKQMAAESLSTSSLPTNFEVALELDELADEVEGEQRMLRLMAMRRVSLELMEGLREFHPRLIGSVWRGTAHRNSDIDLVTYAQDKGHVLNALKKLGKDIIRDETKLYDEHGSSKTSDHIYTDAASEFGVEIVVRPLEDIEEIDICDIFGDPKRGLDLAQLRKILDEDALKKFIPSKRRHSYEK